MNNAIIINIVSECVCLDVRSSENYKTTAVRWLSVYKIIFRKICKGNEKHFK